MLQEPLFVLGPPRCFMGSVWAITFTFISDDIPSRAMSWILSSRGHCWVGAWPKVVPRQDLKYLFASLMLTRSKEDILNQNKTKRAEMIHSSFTHWCAWIYDFLHTKDYDPWGFLTGIGYKAGFLSWFCWVSWFQSYRLGLNWRRHRRNRRQLRLSVLIIGVELLQWPWLPGISLAVRTRVRPYQPFEGQFFVWRLFRPTRIWFCRLILNTSLVFRLWIFSRLPRLMKPVESALLESRISKGWLGPAVSTVFRVERWLFLSFWTKVQCLTASF